MATNAYLTYHDGKLEVPEELRKELRLTEGTRLRVVASGGQIVLDADKTLAEPPSVDWRSLRGALADVDVDFNAELEADRLRENALDARLG